METTKEQIVAECGRVLSGKKTLLEQQLAEISESMENETKSSVGDKHETARARMQTEQDNIQGQLHDVKLQMAELQRLPQNDHEFIQKGSLVKTNNGLFFIGPPIGKIKVGEQELFVISELSPLGKLLCGLKNHTEFSVNGREYRVEGVG